MEFRARQHLFGLGMPLVSVKLETGRKKSPDVNCFSMCIYIYVYLVYSISVCKLPWADVVAHIVAAVDDSACCGCVHIDWCLPGMCSKA